MSLPYPLVLLIEFVLLPEAQEEDVSRRRPEDRPAPVRNESQKADGDGRVGGDAIVGGGEIDGGDGV